MKTENINAMLHYIKEAGISTDNITGGHYKENSILLKRENGTKNTYSVNNISANIDTKNNIVLIKDENTYEYICLKDNEKSYIFNLQTLIVYRISNKKLNVSTISISQTVKDKKDIVNFNSISDFSDKEKIKVLENKVNKLVSDEASYDISDDYVITDGIPDSKKEKVLN